MSKRRGRVRHARRADRRHRRRRDPVLHAPALATRRPSTSTSTWPAAESNENPVYYVQYAHARIAEHPAQGRGGGSNRPGAGGRPARRPAGAGRARRWSSGCSSFPGEVAEAAERRAPHRIAAYATRPSQRLPRLLPRLPGASAPRPRGSSPRGCCSASWRAGRSPGLSGCWGSARRSGCRRQTRFRSPLGRGAAGPCRKRRRWEFSAASDRRARVVLDVCPSSAADSSPRRPACRSCSRRRRAPSAEGRTAVPRHR